MNSSKTAKHALFIYGLILAFSIAGSFIFQSVGAGIVSEAALEGIANATLTHSVFQVNETPSQANFIFVLTIILATGIVMNTVLLWLCRQLLGVNSDRSLHLKNALSTTLAITVICLTLLMAFFMYSVPEKAVIHGHKWLACLSLSVGSFHLAGVPFYSSLFDPGFLGSNFIVQLGIIGGVNLGNLGMFVIVELFSPVRLRQRLADPSIDWTSVTKLSVFAGAIGVGVLSALYFFMEHDQLLAGKNITEMAIASTYEITSARGFGVSLFPTGGSTTALLKNIAATLLAGPFSLGGGLTLLVFSPILFLKSKNPELVSVLLVNKNLLIITAISILVGLLGVLLVLNTAHEIIPLFTCSNSYIATDPSIGSTIIISIIMITGNTALPVAAYAVLNKIKRP